MNRKVIAIEKTHTNHTEQTLTQEEMITENLKRIMSEKKTRLPSIRNQDWKTIKTETEKINELLTYISTNNLTELNELFYSGTKLVCEKNRCSPKDHEQKHKP